MSFLLDTNVISEPQQVRPDESVLKWIAKNDQTRFFLSAVTVGELRKGVERLPSSHKKARLHNWVEELRGKLSSRILPLTEKTFLIWAKVNAEFENRGLARSAFDSLLEATAIEHDLILVTRNVRNFRETSVMILNPWEG
jgi:predicted nucleic acid-binding protein